MTRFRVILLGIIVLVLGGAAGCSGCRRTDILAELAEKGGTVDRDLAASVGTWTTAEVRAEFAVGDGARTGKGSKAILLLSDKSKLSMEESTLVRFLDRPPGAKQRFDLQMGEAVLEAGSGETTLETDFGIAVIHPGGKLALRKTDKGTRYEVSVGTARFEPKGGAAAELQAGQGFLVGIGNAVIERFDGAKTPPEPSAAPPPPSAAPPAADPGGGVSATASGAGATVRAPDAAAFTAMPKGPSEIAAGSTVRLPRGVSVDIARGTERATLRGAGEFVVARPGGSFVAAQSGGVSLSGAESDVKVSVPGGSIVAKAGASADVRVQRDDTKVVVSAGVVEVEGPGGKEELSAGQEASLGKKGAPEVVGRGPGYVDFAVAPGESFAVHDPSPPVAVGFDTGGCSGGAIVDLLGRARTRSGGTGTVSILVPSGAHKYEVRCVEASGPSATPIASGSISVLRDSGTARLPRTAPSTLVDTDGRTYTVLYQNLLPKISARWPGAPAGGPFTLTVSSPGGATQSFTSATASHSFASGALREGAHRLAFQGGGAASKPTTVDIRFDNATPTATLTSPPNGSFGPGATVTVSGVALEGWKISASGRELPLDGQLRFSGEVAAPGGQRALAIRFVNPRRGVHYYLRRTSGH